MKALVTGAGGFVGSALCRALLREGHEVRALSRDPDSARARITQGPLGAQTGARGELTLVAGGIGDPRQIAEAARGTERVFHAAGLPPQAVPARVLRWVHVAGSENVLMAARHAGVRRIVHVSCADVSLCREDRMHWDEKRVLPHDPVGLFAQTKLMAEELMLAASDDALEVVALRPAQLWGPDDVDGIVRLADAIETGRFRLYDGGRNVVATTHIDNLVKAALLASEAPNAAGKAYYVTDGEFLEARELWPRFCEAVGLSAPRTGSSALATLKARAQAALGDQGAAETELLRCARSALFDVSRAVADLGYEPQIALDAKLEELKAWVSAQGGLGALRKRARKAPVAADVEAQVTLAGGD